MSDLKLKLHGGQCGGRLIPIGTVDNRYSRGGCLLLLFFFLPPVVKIPGVKNIVGWSGTSPIRWGPKRYPYYYYYYYIIVHKVQIKKNLKNVSMGLKNARG